MITTHILGSGMAGSAIAKALAVLKVTNVDLPIGEVRFLPRDVMLADLQPSRQHVLCIANPSALHAPRMLEAQSAGYGLIVCEKPTSTDATQLAALKALTGKVAVLHTYRQLWGVQHLRALVEEGFFGRIMALEGRLWQSSRVAHYSSVPFVGTKREWVKDKALTGHYAVSLGLGTHWLDAADFILGQQLSLRHAHHTHLQDGTGEDDCYLNLCLLSTSGVLISGSIANMMHGTRNDFELAVLGEKASARWSFMQPDEIIIGQGRESRTLYRRDNSFGSFQPTFHGLGWLEGYVDILRQSYRDLLGLEHRPYPVLAESNRTISLLLQAMS